MRARRRKPQQEAELDITSFMNLMIILVPVLLMSMVFSHVTVHELILPEGGASGIDNATPEKNLELLIRKDYFDVNYPQGVLLKRINKLENKYNYKTLSTVLQDVKRRLGSQGVEKKAISLLSEENVDYQTIITTMDTVRSFKAVVVASVVDAELFPEISLGDAPVLNKGGK